MKNLHSRKEFLKRLGLSLTGAVASAVTFAKSPETTELIDEQQAFLDEYEGWLKEFQSYIKVRRQQPENMENHKKLMELSAQSEQRKSTLEIYMKDPLFAARFQEITQSVTDSI
ncbi:MAG: hypothetical protein IPM71_00240 [Bacteroidota bacterium]|nr:MAG: hypothetical protein IPM71_00240 [Bacteroidota bacterium]